MDNEENKMWRCTCGGSHFLTIHPDDPEWGPGTILVEEICGPSWIERLRACWAILRGRKHDWVEIVLTPKARDEIVAELGKIGVNYDL